MATLAGIAWDLLTAASVLATAVAIPALVIYVIACVATMVTYARQRNDEFDAWLHGVIPVAAVLLLVAPLAFQYVPFPPAPVSYANWLALGWLVIGFAIVIWLSRTRRETLGRARVLFVDGPE